MSRQNAGFLTFGIIVFIMYALVFILFESVWSFSSQRSVPLMVIALLVQVYMQYQYQTWFSTNKIFKTWNKCGQKYL